MTSLIDQLWDALHENPPRSALVDLAQGVEISDADADAWSKQSHLRAIIPVWSDETWTQSIPMLQGEGLDPAATRRCAVDDLEAEAEVAMALGYSELAALLRKHSDGAKDTFHHGFLNTVACYQRAHQFTALAEGVVFCPCPFTGKLLESRHSFVVEVDPHKQAYIFYRFEGLEPFYVAVAGFVGFKSFLYLPRRQIILQLGHPGYNWGEAQMAIEWFKLLAVRRAAAVHNYLLEATRPAVVMGTINNLGHFFWNDVAGLTRFSALDLTGKLQGALVYRYTFMDPVKFLDRQEALEIYRLETPAALFDTALARNLFCIRPTALRIDPATASCVRQVAEAALPHSTRASLAKASVADTVVWFNLRAHNKSWQEQAAGAIAIANRAKAEGRRLALYLDGMPDCQALVDEIRSGIPEGVEIYEGLNVSINESIAWAFLCDAYICTIGSGLALVTYLAGKDGIAHAEHSHMNQLGFWWEVRPDVPAPHGPRLDDITDLGVGMYCNYSISPNVITDLLFALLPSKPSRFLEKLDRRGRQVLS